MVILLLLCFFFNILLSLAGASTFTAAIVLPLRWNTFRLHCLLSTGDDILLGFSRTTITSLDVIVAYIGGNDLFMIEGYFPE